MTARFEFEIDTSRSVANWEEEVARNLAARNLAAEGSAGDSPAGSPAEAG